MSLNHAMSVRSDFSIGKSLLQADHIIEEAKEHGYESVVLVDDMSIHNIVDFSNKCKKAGIKPVIGCTLRVCNDPMYRKPPKASGEKEVPNPEVHIKVYVKSEQGMQSLLKLLTKANSREYFYYHSRTGWTDVLALKDVIVSTGDFYGLFSHPTGAEYYLLQMLHKFGRENVFCELVPIDTPLWDTLNGKALTMAAKLQLPTLVTYPTLYRNNEDYKTLEVLDAITTNTKMSAPYRSIQYVRDFGFKDLRDVVLKVNDAIPRVIQWGKADASPAHQKTMWLSGVRAGAAIVEACQYEFKKQPPSLPKLADDEFRALCQLCVAGFQRRFSQPVLGYKPDTSEIPKYKERLAYELQVLKNMGFSGYFLLVSDLVNWSKENGILVGPGRGSVGGSLVAYLIGITDVDPIRFNLLFERFINPERLDLPDADLDFMSSRRHEVVQYLQAKYGADRVAGISNFSTMQGAGALRDAGRMHDLSNTDLAATKLVPKEQGESIPLDTAVKLVPELDTFRLNHPEIWVHATKLEGAMRSFGKHAAGVVVGGEPLENRAVVETRETSEGIPIVSWDKRVVEDWGLVKMDVLGLSTLDVLNIARKYIKERHGKTIDYLQLPLEEPDIMDAFSRGDTTGVFQFESTGMRKLLRDLAKGGRLTFEDITAATALYRPGPMDSGLMDDFVAIKQGMQSPYYEHPNMEAALAPTYSVIVYQEQVMQVAIDLAGFTRAGADHLRKAMGKKDKKKMAEMRDQWVDGCNKHSGMDATTAGQLFDKIEAFAGYGFNRSHAVEYSIISYWTMWLRVRYPAEYFAACMSIVAEDKITGLVADAREAGIEILPPDINLSTQRFTIPDDKHILAPFNAVKGISENTALAIMKLRKHARNLAGVDAKGKPTWGAPVGCFESLEHLKHAAAEKNSKVNSRVIENLIKVGATASIDPTQKPARDQSRRRDQMELMPGLVLDAVKADRQTDVTDKFLRSKIIHLVQEYRACTDCDLAGQPHPQVRMQKQVKFMVVVDCPNFKEEKADKMMEGDTGTQVKTAIKAAGLSPSDGYYTALVKAKKNDKFLSNKQLNGCARFFDAELELIKPPVIVAMGSAAIRRLLPDQKGSAQELAGKSFFNPKLDATIVCGINPQQLFFDPSKMTILEDVFKKVAEIVS